MLSPCALRPPGVAAATKAAATEPHKSGRTSARDAGIDLLETRADRLPGEHLHRSGPGGGTQGSTAPRVAEQRRQGRRKPVDIAPLDVPTVWAVVGTSGSAAATKQPGQTGYGQNPNFGLNKDGTQYLDGSGNAWYHTLASLGTANLNTSTPDANTIFDTRTAWAPIATLTNFGTGWTQADQSDIRHMLVTGRAKNGETRMPITTPSPSNPRSCNAGTPICRSCL